MTASIYPNNRLIPLWILSYRESTVVAPIYFLSNDLQYKFYFEIYSQLRLPIQNNQWNFCTVKQRSNLVKK